MLAIGSISSSYSSNNNNSGWTYTNLLKAFKSELDKFEISWIKLLNYFAERKAFHAVCSPATADSWVQAAHETRAKFKAPMVRIILGVIFLSSL